MRVGGSRYQRLQLGGLVGQAGQDGHGKHAGGDPSLGELPDGLQPQVGPGRARLQRPRQPRVERADAHVDLQLAATGEFPQQVQVSQHQV